MNDELIEQLARAICTERDGEEWPNIPATEYDRDLAKAAIAAMQPHIEAQRKDAARRALEAAANDCEGYAVWHNQHDDGLSGFGHMALGASEIVDEIRAIDPAQFRVNTAAPTSGRQSPCTHPRS